MDVMGDLGGLLRLVEVIRGVQSALGVAHQLHLVHPGFFENLVDEIIQLIERIATEGVVFDSHKPVLAIAVGAEKPGQVGDIVSGAEGAVHEDDRSLRSVTVGIADDHGTCVVVIIVVAAEEQRGGTGEPYRNSEPFPLNHKSASQVIA